MKAKVVHHGQGLPSSTEVQPSASACRAWHCRRPSRGKSRADDPSGYSKLVELLLRLRSLAFFLSPVFFFVGLLWCSGTISVMTAPPPDLAPGYVYRSKEIFDLLLPDMISDNSSAVELNTIWTSRHKQKQQMFCDKSTTKYPGSSADLRSASQIGYLIVDANGGLNQQRSSICNAVAVAGILNAILVIPQFHFHNVWMDTSEFRDIYDVDHFINTLKGHVTVVRELPKMVLDRFDNISSIPHVKVEAWAPVSYYLNVVEPILQEQGVIRISPFANRLDVEAPSDIQSLRCLCNYKALRFSVQIESMAKKLVDRMVEKSTESGGKYVAVHLRFEEDMVAFSCCVYDGGLKEKAEMDTARIRTWKKFAIKGRCSRPDYSRMHGRCPLTPLEVGMMLRGMGFNNNTALYLASGKIYNAERNLEHLLQLFPMSQTKESLASPDELGPFQNYSSRLAALDYTVSLSSEVFVTTQGGNFPQFMMGHRRFLSGGHAKTIKPDKKKLVALLHDTDISWRSFKESMEAMLYESNRKGIMLRKSKQSVYTYPSPDCMCLQDQANLIASSTIHEQHNEVV